MLRNIQEKNSTKIDTSSKASTNNANSVRFALFDDWIDDEDEAEDRNLASVQSPCLGENSKDNSNISAEGCHDDVHSLSSESDEIILSVFWRKGMLGAAYYSMETSEISLLNDVVDVSPEFSFLTSLFNQVQPTKVVSSASCSDKFTKSLKNLVSGETHDDSTPGNDLADQKKLILFPGKEYVYEICRQRILNLKLPGSPDDMASEEHVWHIHSRVNLMAESMVLALGMLLRCLEKSFIYCNLEAVDKTTPISAITNISLKDLVVMDSETYEALQIFNQLSHPSDFKRGTPQSNKEGLSMFGILNRCKTSAGCKYMRTMFLSPTHNIQTLNARLDAVEFCYNPKNVEIVRSMIDHLKSIKNINAIMTRLIAARASVKEWKTLHKTIYHSIALGELCEHIASKAKLFKQNTGAQWFIHTLRIVQDCSTPIAECNTEEMYHISHCIDSIIDFSESEKLNKFAVKSGIDEELDRKKLKYSTLPDVMTKLAEAELEWLPSYVPSCSAIYIPEIGFLLAIPKWKENLSEEESQIPGLDLMFSVGQTLHYKSEKARELDEVIGDCVPEISNHESSIMVKLVQFIQEHLDHLHHVIALSAELDCLIALASVAQENNYVRPTLTQYRMIEVENGRHPLQELCVDDYVPNNIYSSSEHGLMKILTGPNACGKSIYLKQVALIVYLAHIGSFVPATSATIGLMDHIHTRIQTIESIAAQISAFAIDVRQMTSSLYSSTPSSLIIVDEFGKGTIETDGLALLTACLEHFLDRGTDCPHIFVSTHFHCIANILPLSPLCIMQTMEYMFSDEGQIVYLYKLVEGCVTSSLAIQTLKSAGVAEATINRASEVIKAMNSNEPITNDHQSRRALEMKERGAIAALYHTSTFTPQDINNITELLNLYIAHQSQSCDINKENNK